MFKDKFLYKIVCENFDDSNFEKKWDWFQLNWQLIKRRIKNFYESKLCECCEIASDKKIEKKRNHSKQVILTNVKKEVQDFEQKNKKKNIEFNESKLKSFLKTILMFFISLFFVIC